MGIMTSIRKQIFEYLHTHPDIALKKLKVVYKDCPINTIREYYRQFKHTQKDMSNMSIDIRTELIKIIKDYKTPASARVQAIREYNNLIEKEPERKGDDPYLKFLEKQNLKIATTIDSSSNQ